MNEKKKILIQRIFWLVVLSIFILVPIIVINAVPEPKLLNSECYSNYSGFSSYCEMELKFDREVDFGSAKIAFYDTEGNWIETKKVSFYGSGKITDGVTTVYGEVDSYEIVSLNFETPTYNIEIMFYFIPLILVGLLESLFLRYREYNFNGKTIAVYEGMIKHYLKIDDEKFDEHNTFVFFTPIKLSTMFNDNRIEATISLTNQISLKINDKLYETKKTK